MLSLADELLLLALDDDKGTIPSSVGLPLRYGLPAAALSELLLAGRLSMGDKQRVSVNDPTPTGDEILDEMVARIREKKVRSLKDWVSSFGNGGIKKLRERLEARLVNKGILRLEEGSFLRVFPWHHYPTMDGRPESETRESLRMVLIGGEDPDPRATLLVSLVTACKLLDKLFPKEERKRADQRAKAIARGEFAGQAVSRAVAEVVASTTAITAALAATTVSTTTSS